MLEFRQLWSFDQDFFRPTEVTLMPQPELRDNRQTKIDCNKYDGAENELRGHYHLDELLDCGLEQVLDH